MWVTDNFLLYHDGNETTGAGTSVPTLALIFAVKSDLVHGGVLAIFRLELAECRISRISGHTEKFKISPPGESELESEEEVHNLAPLVEDLPGRTREADLVVHVHFEARTQEVSKRTAWRAKSHGEEKFNEV